MLHSYKEIPGYRYLEVLGKGGMGMVFLAEELDLQRKVAIKILHKDDNDIEPEVAPILKEARTLAQFSHSNIVQIYQIVDKPEAAIIMEYIDGISLARLQDKYTLNLVEKLNLLTQIASGLNAAHHRGVIHCDIKPDNILVQRDENGKFTAKLTDFGIAQKSHTSSRIDYASYNSCSPEHLTHKTLLPASDMFCFGILAFELLSGVNPFAQSMQANQHEIADAILNHAAMNAHKIVPGLPTYLADMLNSLLNKSPHKRLCSRDVLMILGQSHKALALEKAGAEATQTIQVHTVKEQIKVKSILLVSCVFITVSILGFYQFSSLSEAHPRRVIVLEPQFSHFENQSYLSKNLLSSAIKDALKQQVIKSPELLLLPSLGFEQKLMNVPEIGLSSGADDILRTELSCISDRCEISLSLNRKATFPNHAENKRALKDQHQSWQIVKRVQQPLFMDNYQIVYRFAQEQLASLYHDILKIENTPILMSEKDYETYLVVYDEFHNKGNYSYDNIELITSLITRNPYYYPLYSLAFDLALNQYYTAPSSQLRDRIQSIYESAPEQLQAGHEYLTDGFYIAIDFKDYNKAQEILKSLKDSGIAKTQSLFLEGLYFQYTGQYDLAISAYSYLADLRPTALVYYNIALTHWWQGDLQQVINNLILAKSYNGYSAKVSQLLAAVYLQTGSVSQAIDAYQDIAIQKPDGESYSNLATAYLINGSYRNALTWTKKALSFDQEHAGRLLNHADALQLSGYKKEARKVYQQVLGLSKDKQDLVSLTRKAQALLHLGQGKKALRTINQAKQVAPLNPNVLFISAMILTSLSEYLSAVADIESAIQLGIGVNWFRLPWFKALCESPEFTGLIYPNGINSKSDC